MPCNRGGSTMKELSAPDWLFVVPLGLLAGWLLGESLAERSSIMPGLDLAVQAVLSWLSALGLIWAIARGADG